MWISKMLMIDAALVLFCKLLTALACFFKKNQLFIYDIILFLHVVCLFVIIMSFSNNNNNIRRTNIHVLHASYQPSLCDGKMKPYLYISVHVYSIIFNYTTKPMIQV